MMLDQTIPPPDKSADGDDAREVLSKVLENKANASEENAKP
jgi:hypothetical protein